MGGSIGGMGGGRNGEKLFGPPPRFFFFLDDEEDEAAEWLKAELLPEGVETMGGVSRRASTSNFFPLNSISPRSLMADRMSPSCSNCYEYKKENPLIINNHDEKRDSTFRTEFDRKFINLKSNKDKTYRNLRFVWRQDRAFL